MKDITDFTDPEHEQEHRYCPICDKEIHEGSSLHRCSKKKLKELESRSLDIDHEQTDGERTFDDRLKEFEDEYDNSTYYDANEE